jgi:hypothetical protein
MMPALLAREMELLGLCWRVGYGLKENRHKMEGGEGANSSNWMSMPTGHTYILGNFEGQVQDGRKMITGWHVSMFGKRTHFQCSELQAPPSRTRQKSWLRPLSGQSSIPLVAWWGFGCEGTRGPG